MTSPKERPQKSTARQYAESIGIALILAIVMRSSFVQAYVIPSEVFLGIKCAVEPMRKAGGRPLLRQTSPKPRVKQPSFER